TFDRLLRSGAAAGAGLGARSGAPPRRGGAAWMRTEGGGSSLSSFFAARAGDKRRARPPSRSKDASVGRRGGFFERGRLANTPSSAVRRRGPSRFGTMLPLKQKLIEPRSSLTTTSTASVSSVMP